MAKLCPSRSSIVVRASREIRDGILKSIFNYCVSEIDFAHCRCQPEIN